MFLSSLCEDRMTEGAERGPEPAAWSPTEGPALLRIRPADDSPAAPGPADALPARAAANDDIDSTFVAFLHFIIRDLADHPVGDDLDDAAV
jgi:hypothetical protein